MTDATTEPWGVLFDVDGVLIDSYEAHYASWLTALNAHGLEMDRPLFIQTFGRTNKDIVAHYYPAVPADLVVAYGREKELAFRDIITENFPEMPGADTLLQQLSDAGTRIAVGSSAPPENVKAVLQTLANGHVVTGVVHGQDVTRGKPDPEVFLLAAKSLSLPPERCVVVEDAIAGVAAGKAAGCSVIALTGTSTRDELRQADLVIDTLAEINPETFCRLLN